MAQFGGYTDYNDQYSDPNQYVQHQGQDVYVQNDDLSYQGKNFNNQYNDQSFGSVSSRAQDPQQSFNAGGVAKPLNQKLVDLESVLDLDHDDEIVEKVVVKNLRTGLLVLITVITISLSFVAGYLGYALAGDRNAEIVDIEQGQLEESEEVFNNSTTPVEQVSITSLSDTIEKLLPSVVSIIGIEEVGQNTITTSGTGFVVSSDGYIITNRHVVYKQNAEYSIILNNGKILTMEVIAIDSGLDIAICKVDYNFDSEVVKFGNSTDIQIGQVAVVIGNALGDYSNSVSVGVISGLSRQIEVNNRVTGKLETMKNIIQTDASINSGNSGGPLFDSDGFVVGVNVAKQVDGENIGFAIPIDIVEPLLKSVMQTGKITKAFLGVHYINIDPQIIIENNLKVEYGAWLKNQTPSKDAIVVGSPAQTAGLMEGDIITQVNNDKISLYNNLEVLIQKHSAGDVIIVKFLRDGVEKTLEVTLGQYSG